MGALGSLDIFFTDALTVREIGCALANALGRALGDANTKTVPTRNLSEGLTLQVGDTAEAHSRITIYVDDLSTDGLGLSGIGVGSRQAGAQALGSIRAAIEKVSQNRGNWGTLQNRLEHAIQNLGATNENLTAAESRIRDTDMAKMMMQFTKNNVLYQAAQGMPAQANQQPQQVLQLLR